MAFDLFGDNKIDILLLKVEPKMEMDEGGCSWSPGGNLDHKQGGSYSDSRSFRNAWGNESYATIITSAINVSLAPPGAEGDDPSKKISSLDNNCSNTSCCFYIKCIIRELLLLGGRCRLLPFKLAVFRKIE